MAGIGEDIKEVLEELGSVVMIHNNDLTTVEAGTIDAEGYPDHSTLFTRMFMRSGSVAFDTLINIGQIIEYAGNFHIVTNKVPSEFEGSLIEYTLVTYIANVVGSFHRYNDAPGYDDEYTPLSPWTSYATNVRGCQVEKRLTEDLADHAHILAVSDINNILYVSAEHDVKQADRWTLSSGESYKVESVSPFEIAGVNIVKLGDDERG